MTHKEAIRSIVSVPFTTQPHPTPSIRPGQWQVKGHQVSNLHAAFLPHSISEYHDHMLPQFPSESSTNDFISSF